MMASDFILQTRSDLQEKSEHWKNEELFVKLQRSFTTLQQDLPFFMYKEILDIKKDQREYYLTYTPLKNIGFETDCYNHKLEYIDSDAFYLSDDKKHYTFDGDKVILNFIPTKDGIGEIVYRYERKLENDKCHLELPSTYHRALRMLFLSDIHEKPTRNTKERNLSTHYLGLYDREMLKLKINKTMRPKNVTSKFQRI